MFTENDIEQIVKRGSLLPEIEQQLAHFRRGFPFLKVLRPATIGDGIIHLDDGKVAEAVKKYTQKVQQGLQPVKFVPASGAASRMFQSLFSFAEAADNDIKAAELLGESRFKYVLQFFDRIEDFAFYRKLSDAIEGIKSGDGVLKYCKIIDYVLSGKGFKLWISAQRITRLSPLSRRIPDTRGGTYDRGGIVWSRSSGQCKITFHRIT
jgi:hypothetical protein